PFSCVSIALGIGKEPVVGVVFNPFMNELFEAARGGGAFLNRKRIRVSRVQDLTESFLATGFSYDIQESPDRPIEIFKKMLLRCHSVRRPGSAAMDMCYLARGIFDGFWEEGLKPWDTAAGVVILREAGGTLTTFDGAPYTPYDKTVVASNGLLHDAMLEVLNSS
ncbi:MAG: inositol monophosphatase, partial [Deltaproteobacteria bacterium]|nr:inositol monophosphatase [Deltaproteobacteria bacterium]